ncbi:DUF3147 family protein [Pelagicoccus enzymogenes]|uniref:DUF3147 family protein n=1 Tax=Pelagicoccus enzymogenes TaxID=2773457 RepID=UPI00280FA967|nr:DUF3147 family protein [Pelagicoccus enzymogenes]MDQ8198243.1 DUF3147 family protein [Pelagicoccus enzymogenes]
MIYFLTKVFTSAILIAVISEISKRSSIWAATLASLPLVSLLSIIWIYTEKKNTAQIIDLSKDIFWLVLPSLAFFILLPILLQRGLNFWPSLLTSSLATLICYAVTLKLIS